MRGRDIQQAAFFSTVNPANRVPMNHPLREIKPLVNEILLEMSPVFHRLYAGEGRPSIPPEKLLRALLLQIFYSIRSERQLVEQVEYNLLYRWFVGLSMDDEMWVATTFSKNRDRLLEHKIVREFFTRVVTHARIKGLMSEEHFTVDGAQIEAWASHKSFVPRDEVLADAEDEGADGPTENPSTENPTTESSHRGRNAEVDFHGEKRTNATHYSKTDPDARLMRKGPGQQARLSYYGHALMENRNGLVADVELTQATGKSEREAAITMLERRGNRRRVTLGADKGYDVEEFFNNARALNVTPHVAHKKRTHLAEDELTVQSEEHAVSQRKRKRVEEIFGWMKTVGTVRKTRHKGLEKVGDFFTMAAAAYNLVRIRNLTRQT